jgi:PKD repeat protein
VADYNNDWIKYLKFDANGNATRYDFGTYVTNRPAGTIGGPVQLMAGPDTNLYFIGFNPTGNTNVSSTSKVFRIRYTAGGNTPPIARATATPTSGSTPLTVTFSSAGSTDPDAQALTYSWVFGDSDTSTDAYPMHTYTIPGDYIAVLTVTDAAGATHTDSVAIQVGNNAPVASITAPAPGQKYRVGQVISFSGTGTDVEDGTLTGEQLQWNVLLNHNQHTHPDFLHVSGTSGSFIAPDHGDNTSITICLTATDSRGTSATTCRTIQPETTTYTFRTEPPGLDLSYSIEGLMRTAPFSTTTIVNSEQLIIAPAVQQHRSFSSWSDGGDSAHAILASTEPQTYTATYINNPPVAMAAALPGHGSAPLTVALSSTLSFDPEGDQLGYSWIFSDGSGANTQNVTHSFTRPGAYQATLTVTDELGLASSDTITINVQNNPPLPTIAAPSDGTYGVGTQIDLSGTATDIEDGNLMGDDLVWQIIRHADGATELMDTFTGSSGSFVIPDSASAAQALDQWIEIRLTAVDHNGGSATTSTTLRPRLATLTIKTIPSDLSVRYNGAEQPTPLVITALVGSRHTLEPLPSGRWRFDRWSDDGQQLRTVVLPASGATLTAYYGATTRLPLIRR